MKKRRPWDHVIFIRDSPVLVRHHIPDSKIHGANMGPTWVLSAPDGHHVGPMNLSGIILMMCYCAGSSDDRGWRLEMRGRQPLVSLYVWWVHRPIVIMLIFADIGVYNSTETPLGGSPPNYQGIFRPRFHTKIRVVFHQELQVIKLEFHKLKNPLYFIFKECSQNGKLQMPRQWFCIYVIIPADTLRKNDIIIASKRRCAVVVT